MKLNYIMIRSKDNKNVLAGMISAIVDNDKIIVGMVHRHDGKISQDWFIEDGEIVEDTGEFEYSCVDSRLNQKHDGALDYIEENTPYAVETVDGLVRNTLVSNDNLTKGNKRMIGKLKKLLFEF